MDLATIIKESSNDILNAYTEVGQDAYDAS
jgi:hypothetical protein